MTPTPYDPGNARRAIIISRLTGIWIRHGTKIKWFATITAIALAIKWGAEFVNVVADAYAKVFPSPALRVERAVVMESRAPTNAAIFCFVHTTPPNGEAVVSLLPT